MHIALPLKRRDTPDAMEKYAALSDEITGKYTNQKDVDAIADFLINGYKEIDQKRKNRLTMLH